MGYIIKHVDVEGLWGVKSFKTDLHRDINILIGQNGSSKTTFLNLIEACLMVEIHKLQQLTFRLVSFLLENSNGDQQIIEVRKTKNNNWIEYNYLIGNKNFKISLLEEFDDLYHRFGMNSSIRENILQVRGILNEMVNMSWLSVDRYTENNDDTRRYINVVDRKLDDLTQKLALYRLKLLEGVNKCTHELNTEVLSLLLYDEKTDSFDLNDIEKFASLDAREIKASLYRVFNQMGNMRQMSDRIQTYIGQLTKAIERVRAGQNLMMNDIAALVLISKTIAMIDLSKKHKEAVDKLMEPIDTYNKILHRFIKDKEFTFSEESGQLQIEWMVDSKSHDRMNAKLEYYSLSSGEKQLLILLTQTLLQEKQPYIFVADEPELSLHIEWQRNIINAINDLNPNAQVIVATHSPEIAGLWSLKIIRMENITTYGEF